MMNNEVWEGCWEGRWLYKQVVPPTNDAHNLNIKPIAKDDEQIPPPHSLTPPPYLLCFG